MKPPTMRQRVLAELQASTVPLRASEIAVRLDANQLTVSKVLVELRCAGRAVLSAGRRWVALGGLASPRPSCGDRVLAELAAAQRPLLACHLAARIGAERSEVKSCLGRLRRNGLVTYLHPWRWVLASKAPEVLPVPPVEPIDRVRRLIADGEVWQVGQAMEALSMDARAVRKIMRLLVGKGEVVCTIDRVTGARSWRAVRP